MSHCITLKCITNTVVTDYPFFSTLAYSSQRDVTYKEIKAEMKDITADIRIVCKTVMASYIGFFSFNTE